MKYSGFYTSRDLAARYKISLRTLNRWVNRSIKPFPIPTIPSRGGKNRWAYEVVDEWEKSFEK